MGLNVSAYHQSAGKIISSLNVSDTAIPRHPGCSCSD
jgi:hypothetical protein